MLARRDCSYFQSMQPASGLTPLGEGHREDAEKCRRGIVPRAARYQVHPPELVRSLEPDPGSEQPTLSMAGRGASRWSGPDCGEAIERAPR